MQFYYYLLSVVYTGSYLTLITSDLEKQLNVKGISQKLEISNVISTAKAISLKLVNFSVKRTVKIAFKIYPKPK